MHHSITFLRAVLNFLRAKGYLTSGTPPGGPALPCTATRTTLRPFVLKLPTDGRVQPSKVAIDFRWIALDDNFPRNLPDRREIEHLRFPLQLISVVPCADGAEEYSFSLTGWGY